MSFPNKKRTFDEKIPICDIACLNGAGVRVDANKWYTLRYELYATGAAETYITKIYIGEGDAEPVCVAEVNAYTEALITDISKFRLVWQRASTEYTVYLDDVSLIRRQGVRFRRSHRINSRAVSKICSQRIFSIDIYFFIC